MTMTMMTDIKHFEELWESAEQFHQHSSSDSNVVFNELLLKIKLYQSLSDSGSEKLPAQELHSIKTMAFGEILLTLTHLSYAENIDTFQALGNALNHRK